MTVEVPLEINCRHPSCLAAVKKRERRKIVVLPPSFPSCNFDIDFRSVMKTKQVLMAVFERFVKSGDIFTRQMHKLLL